jgi:ferredoxin
VTAMRVTLDGAKCQGHAQCNDINEDVFDADDDATPLADVPVALADQADVRLAVANCPERAISITE